MLVGFEPTAKYYMRIDNDIIIQKDGSLKSSKKIIGIFSFIFLTKN